MLAPSVMNTNITMTSETVATSTRMSRSCSECIASPSCSMLPTIRPARNAPRYPLPPAVSMEKYPAEITAITAIAADSRQRPALRLYTAAERTTPKTTPMAVEITRLTTKSCRGCVSDALPRENDAGDRQREHGTRRIVERGLGDDRLRDLRPKAETLEERNQNRRIGGGEYGADEQP